MAQAQGRTRLFPRDDIGGDATGLAKRLSRLHVGESPLRHRQNSLARVGSCEEGTVLIDLDRPESATGGPAPYACKACEGPIHENLHFA
jgi:hypothetical protein